LKWKDSSYVYKEEEEKWTDANLAKFEKFIDSAYSNNHALLTYYFEKGMDFYAKDDYVRSRSMFAKARVTRTPVFRTAEKMFQLMNNWDMKRKSAEPLIAKMNSGEEMTDSTRLVLCNDLFALGRIHEELGNLDSVKVYYKSAADYAPVEDPESSRFIYAYSRIIRDDDAFAADSLLDIIVMNHPLTEFGKD